MTKDLLAGKRDGSCMETSFVVVKKKRFHLELIDLCFEFTLGNPNGVASAHVQHGDILRIRFLPSPEENRRGGT